MFENLSYLALQQYWWAIVSLLGALLVFLLFVQGGQTLIYTLGKTENQRKLIVNALGRKWEFTFTTLVTFGGAFFASFPLFYSTSFGGAYWVWMLILFSFVIQAVSYEFRTKTGNFLGSKTYESFLYINGVLGSVLLGVAVSTFFTGAAFSVDLNNITNLQSTKMLTISSWETPYHGLEAVWTIQHLAFLQNLSLGFAVFFLARTLAILYFQKSIDQEDVIKNAKKHLIFNSVLFLTFFLFWLIRLLFLDGYHVDQHTKMVSMQPFKYAHNLMEMPAVWIILLIGIGNVLWGIFINIFKKSDNGIWFSGLGTIMTVFALFLIAGYNHTAFYPSTFNIQNSLTIENASSSKYTLVAMSYVSLMVPFVIAYIFYAWKKMDASKISESEINNDTHAY
jgi:cytochrome bd ubiquinol oxidase subunit II